MKDFNKIKDECLKEVMDAGIEPGNIVEWKINPKFTRLWGRCKRRIDKYTIEIAERLITDDRIPEKAVKDTVVHEILHSAPGGSGHTGKWKEYAAIMNAKYGYNIKRLTSGEEKGVENYVTKRREIKYRFICKNCRRVKFRKRKCDFTRYYRNYTCPFCGQKRAYERF